MLDAVRDRPPSLTFWLLLFCTLVYVAETVLSFLSATDRARWERETRQAVRIGHAIRHHVSVGAANRALVTERTGPGSLAVAVIVLCLFLVGRAAGKARLARRWLADPLPRPTPDDPAPAPG